MTYVTIPALLALTGFWPVLAGFCLCIVSAPRGIYNYPTRPEMQQNDPCRSRPLLP